jgi:hypothetical protein
LAGRENWPEADHKKDNEEVNGRCFTGMFAPVDDGEVRFISGSKPHHT